ncbi:MAG: aspartyl protease family protein [Prevotella sp.]|nr:aspartyl protease family protein [Prevotella sp.]
MGKIGSSLVFMVLAFGMVLPSNAQYFSKMSIEEKDFCDTIPIEYRRGRVFIPVEIEGRTHQFIFDTGCSIGLMFTDRALTLKNKFGFALMNDAANHIHLSSVKRIPKMRVGNVTVRNYQVVLSPSHSIINNEYDCQQIVGCIGSNLFSKCRAMKIDTEKGIMVITDRRGVFDSEEGFRFPFKEDVRVPYLQVSTRADKSRWCLFDTGYPGFLDVRRKDITEADTLDTAIGSITAGVYGKTADERLLLLRLDSLRIGDCVFRQVTTNQQSANDYVLGSSILKFGSMVIDYNTHQMIFRPYHYDNGVTVANTYSDFAMMPRADGNLYVTLVWSMSRSYASGLRLGDRLTHIDGIDVGDNPCAYMNLASGEHIITFISTEGEKKEIPIEK